MIFHIVIQEINWAILQFHQSLHLARQEGGREGGSEQRREREREREIFGEGLKILYLTPFHIEVP